MEKRGVEHKVAFLREVHPFTNLTDEALRRISDSFSVRKFNNRDLIFYQGDTTCDFCIIKSGKVRVMTINEAGEESCLRILTTRDVLGELSAYDGAPRCASAQALGPCTLLVMRHHDFTEYLKTMPNLALAFIKFLSEKLRWTTLFSHTLAQYDTAGRLLQLLIYYKDVFGREIVADKAYEIDLSLTQADLASMVGSQREWVNRLRRKWRNKRMVDYQRGKIILILDTEILIGENDKKRLRQLLPFNWQNNFDISLY
jgi:CRP/FNR family transcriptional regulator